MIYTISSTKTHEKVVIFPPTALRVPVRYSKVRLGGLRRHLGVQEEGWWNHSNLLGYWLYMHITIYIYIYTELAYDPKRSLTINHQKLMESLYIVYPD